MAPMLIMQHLLGGDQILADDRRERASRQAADRRIAAHSSLRSSSQNLGQKADAEGLTVMRVADPAKKTAAT